MAIDFRDTFALAQAMERIKPPASFLLDTFFPIVPPVAVQAKIAVEYKKSGRTLAPFVVRGGKGVNMKREGSKLDIYKPPMMGPRMTLDPEDIEQRGFGEGMFSTITPAQRATMQQAHDLVELQNSIINRKNKMAAEIMTTGKCSIEGYADDGKTKLMDDVTFDWNQIITPARTWDNADATIYEDIRNASGLIQENAGIVPTTMICGKNVPGYILKNDQIMKWMYVPSTDNISMMGFQPRIMSPQVSRVGYIQALNLEIYCYQETYKDEDDTVKPFIGDDDVIIAIPGRGKQMHGAVTLVNDDGNGYDTYAATYVPYYIGDRLNQEVSLAMYSRCILAPEFVDDWVVIKAK